VMPFRGDGGDDGTVTLQDPLWTENVSDRLQGLVWAMSGLGAMKKRFPRRKRSAFLGAEIVSYANTAVVFVAINDLVFPPPGTFVDERPDTM